MTGTVGQNGTTAEEAKAKADSAVPAIPGSVPPPPGSSLPNKPTSSLPAPPGSSLPPPPGSLPLLRGATSRPELIISPPSGLQDAASPQGVKRPREDSDDEGAPMEEDDDDDDDDDAAMDMSEDEDE